MITLTHEIFVDSSLGDSIVPLAAPFLVHVFYGLTREQCRARLLMHSQYDDVLKAALLSERFSGVDLRCAERWGESSDES